MAKDKVFGAKVSNGKQYIDKGKSWLDYYYEDQEKRRKEAEEGKVRYTEAAKASRIQYTLPQYQGKSQNQGKTYQWERDLMQNEKIKGAGNSYTKKFDALTSSMGMTPGQAEEFRKYMDFQEDSQHVDPKLNKDKSIKQNQSLKYARDARMKTDVIDGILKNMQNTTKARSEKDRQVPFEKVNAWDKVQNALGFEYSDEQKNTLMAKDLGVEPHYGGKKDKTDPVLKTRWEDLQATKEREDAEAKAKEPKETTEAPDEKGNALDKILGFFTFKNDIYGNPIGETNERVKKHLGNNTSASTIGEVLPGQNPDEGDRFLAQLANVTTGGINKEMAIQNGDQEAIDAYYNKREFGEGGGTDMIAQGLGYLAPAGKLYKGVNSIKALTELGAKGAAPRIMAEALKGGAVGGAISTGEVGVREAINPENQNAQENLNYIGMNTALGAALDPALYGAGVGLKKGAQEILGRFAKVDGEIPTFTGQASDNVLDSLVPNQQGNIGNYTDVYDELLKQANPGVREADEAILAAQAQRQELENAFVRQELYEPKGPKPNQISGVKGLEAEIRDQFQRTPQARQIDEVLNQLTGQRESALNAPKQDLKINNWQDRAQAPSQNNIVNNSQAPEEVLESLARPETNPAAPKKPSEQEFIEQELAPFREAATKQAQARQTWETVVKGAQEQASRIKQYYGKIVPDGMSKDAINEIPPQFRAARSGKGNDIYSFAQEEGFSSADEAIAFLKQIDLDSKMKLKDLMPEDNYVLSSDEWDALEQVARQKYAETHGGQQPPEAILDELVQNEAPKPETEAVSPAQAEGAPTTRADELLLRLDSQSFAPSTATSLVETRAPISTEGPIAKQSNFVKRKISKFYEGYVNRNHGAKLTEVQSLETAIKKAKTEGRTKKAEQLNQRLKSVKKHGSDFDKALGNELASSSAAKNVLDRHFATLADTMGGDMKEMSGALEFQMAKNLDWIKRNVDPNYELPNGWDWGDINTIINSGRANAKYGDFVTKFRDMTQELRDTRLDYGLISKESHEALGKNPFYIPMQRDMSQVMDNIDIGNLGVGRKGRGSGDGTLHKLDGGSVETFFKNPMETVIDQAFQLYKTAYRNDTAQQALKMAKLDKDGTLGLAKEIHEKSVKKGDLTVYVNGQKKYVRLQDDLAKMLNENESVLDLGKIGKVTQLFAALKTRSFEYQTAAAPRDLAQAYLTSQVGNPVRYFGEMMKAIKNKSANAKEVGAYFDKAYNDHVAGVDPNKILKEFQQKAGNVKTFNLKDPQSWKEVGGVVKKILDTPFKPSKFLGQITDEIPREIEVKEAERLFMKKHGKQMEILQNQLNKVDAQITAAQGAPAFSPQTQGIDKLIGQKDKIERTLRQFNQELKREQVYRGRDVMDYSRMGNSKATKNIIRPWVIFANTTTQSKDKVIRSFIERPGATIAKMTAITAPFVAAEKINFDNMDDSERKMYDALPSWLKQFNYVYIDNGNTYAVPKLHELALITNPIEAALKGDSLDDSMKLLAKETVPYQWGNVAQGLVPDEDGKTLFDRDPMTKNVMGAIAPSTVLGPASDVLFNDKTTFNRKPISYSSDKSNKWTMDLFTDLIGKNPNSDAAQYLYQQYLGDFGKYTSYVGNAAKDPSNGDKIDEMLRNLNPLQDRIFKENSRYFKTTPQETKK